MNNEKMKAAFEKLRDASQAVVDALGDSDESGPVTGGTPWVDVARKYEGLEEERDNELLSEFLGIDPEETSWCAVFVNKCLEEAGYEGTGSLRARDFADYGTQCNMDDGAIAVFRKHVGFVVKGGEKLLGGNQKNMVKESNLKWYHENMEFLGYRFPTV